MALWDILNNKAGQVSRYFRRNLGIADYATIPSATLSGDFVISGQFLTTNSASVGTMIGSSVATVSEVRIDILSSGAVRMVVYNSTGTFVGLISSPAGFNDGGLHTFTASMSSTTAELIIDGVSVGTGSFSLYDGVNVANLYRRSDNINVFAGILANLRIYDNGVLVRDYPLDDNSSDLREKVSGQNGTVISGLMNDWGLFREFPTLWKGQNLIVPPWASVDQELLKA